MAEIENSNPDEGRTDPTEISVGDPELRVLFRPLFEFSHIVARSLVGSARAELPRVLGPIVKFQKLPDRALASVVAALDDESFRSAVASRADEVEVGEAAMLFLERPDGWREDLAALVDEFLTSRDAARSGQDDALDHDKVIADLRSELDAAQAEVKSQAEARAASESQRESLSLEISELKASVADLANENERLASERSKAVREWKNFERKSSEFGAENLRLASAFEVATKELERARTKIDALVAQGLDAEAAEAEAAKPDPKLLDAISRLESSLAEIRSELDAVKSQAGIEPSSDSGLESAEDSPDRQSKRRRPTKVGRGLHDDSVQAAELLFDQPNAIALVDGYNVSMLSWPHLSVAEQRDQLVGRVEALAGRFRATFFVVFDGDGDGGRQLRASVGSKVRVRFTPTGTEADDEIINAVSDFEPSMPVVVVSNDRRVQSGASRGGANIVSSTRFSEFL